MSTDQVTDSGDLSLKPTEIRVWKRKRGLPGLTNPRGLEKADISKLSLKQEKREDRDGRAEGSVQLSRPRASGRQGSNENKSGRGTRKSWVT